MRLGKWELVECNYCQGAIGEDVVWFGGHPFHPQCLHSRNYIYKMITDLEEQAKKDRAERP